MKRPAAVTPEPRPRKARASAPSPLVAHSDDAFFVVHIGAPPLESAGLRAQLREGEETIAIGALRALFGGLSLWKEDSKLYAQCYYRIRGEVVLFGLFNAVHILHRRAAGLLCESAGKRKYYYSLLVVLEGSVVLSVDNKEGEVLQPGKTLFLAFHSWQVFARGTVAATVALASLEPIQRRPNRKHLEKTVQELAETGAQVKELRLQRHPSETEPVVAADSARGQEVATAGAVVDAAAGVVAAVAAEPRGESCERTGAQPSACVGRPPATRVALQAGMRMRWPEHRGVLLHRFYISEAGAPLEQWREL